VPSFETDSESPACCVELGRLAEKADFFALETFRCEARATSAASRWPRFVAEIQIAVYGR